MTAVGVSATIATYRGRPGLYCFHGSLWHTEDCRQAVCLHFGDNHRRLIESAVLSWESLLKIQRVMAVMIGIVLPLLGTGAQAAELKVYSSTAVKAVLEELGPQFEKATGDKLVFTFGLSSAVKKQIDEGAAFDVAVLTPALIDGLAAGKIDPASRVAIARVGSGVAVPAGSPKPDVSTAEALKRTLLQAKSIGFTGVGVSRAVDR